MRRAWAPLISIAIAFLMVMPAVSSDRQHDPVTDRVALDGPSLGMNQDTHFIRNMGQWEKEFEFVSITEFGAVGFAPDGLLFNVYIDEQTEQVVKYDFKDCNDANVVGSDRLSHHSNFFLGNDPSRWKHSVPNFGTITYEKLWDGIDLVYSIDDCQLKYEFILEPYSSPEDIQIEVQGANGLFIDSIDLTIELENDILLRDSDLLIHYADGDKETVPGRFILTEENTFSFHLQDHDRTRPVIIDPFIEVSTFIGSSNDDDAAGFQRDADGNIYGFGITSWSNFPVTTGVYQSTNAGSIDMVIFKMNKSMSTLIYSTYLGGSGVDMGRDLAIGSNGSLYIVGDTHSNNFPTSPGAYDTTYQPSSSTASESDGFIIRLDENCTSLGLGTYLGVKNNETVWEIVIDSSDNIIVVGDCQSNEFPTTSDAYDRTFNGQRDIFILKMNSSGDKILHSTFLGGGGWESCYDIDTTNGGNTVYLTGDTWSSNFPTTPGAYDTTFNTSSIGYNLFVSKYNISSGSLEMSTFIGIASGIQIKLDDAGNIHVSGTTRSSTYPATSGAYGTSRAGQEDGIYSKLDPTGSSLLYSTYLGGSAWDTILSFDINSTGSVFLYGNTRSSNFPTTKGCYDSSYNNGWDIFITRLNSGGDRLVYSTYLGGVNDDRAGRIEVIDEDLAIIMGDTRWTSYPTTTGVYDTSHNGGYDLFLSKVNLTLVLVTPENPLNLTGIMTGDQIDLQWKPPIDDGGSPILNYNVYRGTLPTSLELIGTTSDLRYRDSGLDLRETYYYTVTATNSIGESPRHLIVSFRETEPPTFNEDLTPNDPLPGTEIALTANFTDNVEVLSVNVEYWIGGSIHQNISMDNATGNDIWTLTIPLPDDNIDLTYKFSAIDIKGNRMGTEFFMREIRGEVYPVLWNDGTPMIAAPSTDLVFSIEVRDNHKVDQVKVEFWVDQGVHDEYYMFNVDGTNTYIYTTSVPNVLDKNLYYIFKARDNDLKWNQTLEKAIPIIDILKPEFLVDNSDKETATGSTMNFMVSVKDNLHVSGVNVDYWYDGGHSSSLSMTRTTGNQWRKNVDVPLTASFLYYSFKGIDPSGNMNSTRVKVINITDPISPVFINDSSDKTAFSGSIFSFNILGSDNIGLKEVKVEYWFYEDEHQQIKLAPTGDRILGSLDIPIDEDGTLFYSVILIDSSENSFTTGTVEIDILDMIPPTIQKIEDVSLEIGEYLYIEANATDNVGVKTISWIGGPFSSNDLVLEGEMNENRTYQMRVIVTDPSGNTAITMFRITVTTPNRDTDQDGIPDQIEDDLGLDREDHFDGFGDLDSDGLENWVEYGLGLNLTNPDSDGDGMPDKWEFDNGLDPRIASSTEDYDEDGLSDLEEYLQGTDPRVSDEVIVKTDEFDATILIILLIILILALLGIWGLIGFRYLKKEKVELPPMPEPENVEEEIDKMLHDLPQEQVEPISGDLIEPLDFEGVPEGSSSVSDLFDEQKPAPQEEELPPGMEPPIQEEPVTEPDPFAEQPLETLQGGEVIQ